ncbi:chemotaxis protein CheW [Pilimelia anulata]|uniref:chemotaxis protein CheW n=1 Tax=Pilimelia anulata TaxID=53371 RepID=UPI001E42E077|nr:chemotaxis protein CheW [Pilimelia anulata]
MNRRALLFRAGPLLCGLPLEDVVETMRPLPVRPLADLPPYAAGITVVRGAPVPVLDAATLLGGAAGPVSRFIAVRADPGPVVLATGEVLGVDEGGGEAADRAGADRAGMDRAAAGPGVGGIRTHDAEPLLLLRGATLVPDAVWDALDRHAGVP